MFSCCCCCWRMTSFLVVFMSGHKTINSIGLAYRTIKIRSFTSEMVKCRYSITWPPLVTHWTRGWKKGTPKFTRTPPLFEQINQMPRTKCQIRDSTRLISLSPSLLVFNVSMCESSFLWWMRVFECPLTFITNSQYYMRIHLCMWVYLCCMLMSHI